MNPDTVTSGDDETFELDLGENPGGKSRFLVKDGQYEATVVDVVRETSKSGNDMFTWSFQLGPDGNDIKLKVWALTAKDKCWTLVEVLSALGREPTSFSRKDVIGKRVIVTTKAEEFNGKLSSKIINVAPHPKGPKGNVSDAPF